MADSIPVVLGDETEDFTKKTFDFWRNDDEQMDTLDEVAQSLAVDRLSAARMILGYPFPEAIPVRLMKEAADEASK